MSGALSGIIGGVSSESIVPGDGRNTVEISILVVPVDHRVGEASWDRAAGWAGGRGGSSGASC